jgi:hypothetical protein
MGRKIHIWYTSMRCFETTGGKGQDEAYAIFIVREGRRKVRIIRTAVYTHIDPNETKGENSSGGDKYLVKYDDGFTDDRLPSITVVLVEHDHSNPTHIVKMLNKLNPISDVAVRDAIRDAAEAGVGFLESDDDIVQLRHMDVKKRISLMKSNHRDYDRQPIGFKGLGGRYEVRFSFRRQ